MSIVASALPRKYFLFAAWTLALGFTFYFIFMNIPRYFREGGFSEDMVPFKLSFMVHFVMGTIMIVFGPLQFVSWIRRSHPRIHRFIGKAYIISVCISGAMSLYLAIVKIIVTEKLIIFGTGLVGLGLASLFTTMMAYRMVLNKKYELHRQWMVRSYVVTLGFVTFRIFTDLVNPAFFHLDGLLMVNIMAWACWIPPLLIAEFFLRTPAPSNSLAI